MLKGLCCDANSLLTEMHTQAAYRQQWPRGRQDDPFRPAVGIQGAWRPRHLPLPGYGHTRRCESQHGILPSRGRGYHGTFCYLLTPAHPAHRFSSGVAEAISSKVFALLPGEVKRILTSTSLLCQVPGGSNVNNYANVQLIADTAERCGADAVWPGWGHASENPHLPEMLAARGWHTTTTSCIVHA